MSDELNPCTECGMPCSVGEYHPYAACLMFKACHNSETVRANLDFVRNTRPDSKPSPITEVLEKISRVAHGEDQVGEDDAEGMAWIAEFVDKHLVSRERKEG